jgi:hypothetical protein
MGLDMSRGMLKLFSTVVILLSLQVSILGNQFDFDIIKKGDDDNNTLLIVGGIQGDEPGGFVAASLIATHYKITKGSVWVVPNLNFYSIIKRNRGSFGDVNRKFSTLSEDDPDYFMVQRIKKYIVDPKVSMVINLHDGSGFYRKKYIDKNRNPYKWGNSSIIDQEYLPNVTKYKNIKKISDSICRHVNKNLIDKEHVFATKNTHTRFKKTKEQNEMSKTLTYFAISNGKAAIGNESSKNLPTHERVYYKLLSIEKLMDEMGIEYERKLSLKPYALKDVIDNDIYITFYNDKIVLPLGKIKHTLRYFPISKDGKLEFRPSNPLMTVLKSKKYYVIYYGNRRVLKIQPDFTEFANIGKDERIKLKLDNYKNISIPFGSVVETKKSFYIYPKNGYRVNVIGYVNKKHRNESGLNISKKAIPKRFAIDKKHKTYRVEFYKNKKFAGMILVKFTNKISVASKYNKKEEESL